MRVLFVCSLFAIVACGDNLKATSDASPVDAEVHAVCGNAKLEPGEQCDDGNSETDLVCDATCHFTCGNGTVDTGAGETCDTGIAVGDGACPTACDDGMACTSDVLMNGGGCQAACLNVPITDPVAGDGCCPTGATSLTDSDCSPTCGNGTVDTGAGETCDTGIAVGDGACPTACDDGMACTSDVLMNGGGCQAACLNVPITDPVAGDGCCPTGATSLTDSDCSPTCGNGAVEAGETCDTAIATGPGACPTSCDDAVACTTDTLMSGGTCQAACMHTAITMPKNGDGCCPTGANHNNDTDCSATCGNGTVEPPGETCDTAIASGPGKCPTSCSDGVACTKDVLSSAGTCQAACSFPAITMPANGDGCCPAGANANNDNDCAPVCGNGVVESGEQCDDGNANPDDGCDMCKTVVVGPTAFRMSDLDLRDPHVFVNFIGCRDVTDTALAGFSVNGALQDNIQKDADGDGFLDLSPTIVFRPLAQAQATTPVEIHFATCTAPIATTSCTAGTGSTISATATNMMNGQCLAAIANTTHGYTPAITTPSGPCFVSSAVTVTISLGGIPITLHDARIAATYVGNPAGQLANGLLIGFISETDANNTIIPSSFPLVGGKALSALLPGGDPPGTDKACTNYSDKDTDNGVTGWWFYLNFPATKVTWSDN